MNEKTKDMLKACGFGKQIELVEKEHCPLCGLPINMKDFTDLLSKSEYEISGMCQKCQDSIFGGE